MLVLLIILLTITTVIIVLVRLHHAITSESSARLMIYEQYHTVQDHLLDLLSYKIKLQIIHVSMPNVFCLLSDGKWWDIEMVQIYNVLKIIV